MTLNTGPSPPLAPHSRPVFNDCPRAVFNCPRADRARAEQGHTAEPCQGKAESRAELEPSHGSQLRASRLWRLDLCGGDRSGHGTTANPPDQAPEGFVNPTMDLDEVSSKGSPPPTDRGRVPSAMCHVPCHLMASHKLFRLCG